MLELRIADREDPDQTAKNLRSRLILDCTICLGHFLRYLVFIILEHVQIIEFQFSFFFFLTGAILTMTVLLNITAKFGETVLLNISTKFDEF